jgi:hypothetical protein
LLLGPLAGAAAGAGLYFARTTLQPLLPPPWDDLLQLPVFIGQGAFVAALVLVLLEWLAVRPARRALAQFTVADRSSWAGRARRQALLSFRPHALQWQRRRLGRQAGRHWLIYALLGLTPAGIGLVLGLEALQAQGEGKGPFLQLFAPLLVGSAEGVLLWLLGLAARRSMRRLLDDWLSCCERLEAAPARNTRTVAQAANPTALDTSSAPVPDEPPLPVEEDRAASP